MLSRGLAHPAGRRGLCGRIPVKLRSWCAIESPLNPAFYRISTLAMLTACAAQVSGESGISFTPCWRM